MAADSSSHTFDKLSALCHEWLQYDPNPATRSEIEKLFAAAKDEHEKGTKPSPNLTLLGERMLVRIAFGTAGLRARMAAGYACMNDLVIIQTSQGLGKHLLATHSLEDCAKRGVIVGYDGRHNSRKYAEITSAVFLSMGISVHLFNRLTCTPMVPFSVLEFKAVAGVMVTASHNPKDDNGYKVYWENGAQIIPPLDAHIAAAIRENLKPWQAYVFDPKHPLLKDPTDAATAKYFGEIEKRYCWTRELNPTADLKITFTPMHGVGGYWSSLAFKSFHLPPFIPVPEQIEPDPEFSTVKFPNPEEGKGALALAMKCAEAHGSTVIIANDPDADRLAAAEFDTAAKQWVIFNGNQIAVLLSDWVFQNWTKHYPVADKSKLFMLNSTVSSKYLQAMARAEGFHYQDTLTGFKWMGNVASDLIKKGLTFLFAYEVEIGFLVGDLSLDKDGVRLAAIFAEMANHVYKSGKSLNQHLETLYKKYGFFEMNTSYFFCYTAEGFERVFGRLRSGNNGSYVDTCGPFKIKSVRDVTLGLDTSRDDKKSLLPATPDSQMLTFSFEDGSTATLRNSGTEPKLKYYVECSDKESRQNARAKVDELTKYIISEFLQPEKNGLVPKPAA